jgi:4-alpha-glucanotransferase
MIGRGSGVLNHITSLPSPYGIGDLGPSAYRFAGFLTKAKQRYWQILPVTAVSPDQNHSPYSGPSAFAGNILLISPESMVTSGWVPAGALQRVAGKQERMDFTAARSIRALLFHEAHERFVRNGKRCRYEEFCARHADWLDDFALFMILKRDYGGRAWHCWPGEIRDRHPRALQKVRSAHRTDLERIQFQQYLFYEQWEGLREHCRRENIYIIGDVPFYVSHDSADVWANPEIFQLDAQKKAIMVSGAAPEMFNSSGQKWGHPTFRWEVLKQRNYDWWLGRLRHNLLLYDFIRLDHFQGFFSYWEIPARARTARHGREIAGPGMDLFMTLGRAFSLCPIIAEDLGNITAATREAIKYFNLPGMKPLLFAFDEKLPSNPYAPHNIGKNSVVYTGTHDCNTVKGWFEEETAPEDRRRLNKYLGKPLRSETVARAMVQLALSTVADTAIIPLQDLLGLGAESRMNRPGTARGNWLWRFSRESITPGLARRLAELTAFFGRA